MGPLEFLCIVPPYETYEIMNQQYSEMPIPRFSISRRYEICLRTPERKVFRYESLRCA
jgi:hypothetical protein